MRWWRLHVCTHVVFFYFRVESSGNRTLGGKCAVRSKYRTWFRYMYKVGDRDKQKSSEIWRLEVADLYLQEQLPREARVYWRINSVDCCILNTLYICPLCSQIFFSEIVEHLSNSLIRPHITLDVGSNRTEVHRTEPCFILRQLLYGHYLLCILVTAADGEECLTVHKRETLRNVFRYLQTLLNSTTLLLSYCEK